MTTRKTIKGIDRLGIKKTQTEIASEEFEKFNDLKDLIEDHFINEVEVTSADSSEIILRVSLRKGTGSLKKLRTELYGNGYR